LREDFDKGIVTSIDPDVCPHDIATLLKEFFRDLPEPLLCRHLYKGFLQTQCELRYNHLVKLNINLKYELQQ
jgi:RhoGAP domain